MAHINQNKKPLWKNFNLWLSLLFLVALITGLFGYAGEKDWNIWNIVYSTLQMFMVHHTFTESIHSVCLEISRWAAFFFFILGGGHLIIHFRSIKKWVNIKKINWFYKKHIIICSLNEIAITC